MAYVPTGNPIGRPRTTTDKLPENWRQIMLDIGQAGGSAVECRVKLGIEESAWNTLLEDSEDFRRTEKARQELCEMWWETVGRNMATGANGNSAVWIFNMKNRFGWRDTKHVDATISTPKPIAAFYGDDNTSDDGE